MELREKYTRQFLRFSCDSQDTISPDFSFVCSDGVVFAHKFMVLGFMPKIQQLLCGFCQDSHEEIKMIMTDVTKAELEIARDFLYMFGDAEPFEKIFKGKIFKDSSMMKTFSPRITFILKILDPEASLKPDAGRRGASQKILGKSGETDMAG